MALGREVIRAGYTVLFVPALALVAQLAKAHGEGRLEERLVHFAKAKLLIFLYAASAMLLIRRLARTS